MHIYTFYSYIDCSNSHTCCTNMCNLQTRQAWFMGKTNGSFIQNTKTVGFGGFNTFNVEIVNHPPTTVFDDSAPVPSCHRPKQRCSTSSRKRSIPTARGSTSFCVQPVPSGTRDSWFAPMGAGNGWVIFFSLRNGKKIIKNNRDDGLKGNWPECECWNGDLMLVWNHNHNH